MTVKVWWNWHKRRKTSIWNDDEYDERDIHSVSSVLPQEGVPEDREAGWNRALRLLKQSRLCELTVAYAALRRVAFLIYALAGAEIGRGLAADKQEGVPEDREAG
jgi:hypothetical protein